MTFDAALAANASIIQLVTWNDYGEGTIIEPTAETGYQALEIVQQSARRWTTRASITRPTICACRSGSTSCARPTPGTTRPTSSSTLLSRPSSAAT